MFQEYQKYIKMRNFLLYQQSQKKYWHGYVVLILNSAPAQTLNLNPKGVSPPFTHCLMSIFPSHSMQCDLIYRGAIPLNFTYLSFSIIDTL